MILRRLWSGALTALGVTALVFLVLRLVPGDPVDLMIGENAAPADREQMRERVGLHGSVPMQAARYLTSIARGDLGMSITRRRPVASLIMECIPYTALLAAAASCLANLFGIPAGVWAAYRPRGRAARAALLGCVAATAIPVFWLGPLLVLALALRWPWLPVSSIDQGIAAGIVLPTLTMALGLAAHVTQTTRAAVTEVLAADFIRTAQAKGAGPLRVLFGHALPAAGPPILTVSALQFGHLLAGAVVTEMIFDWPGLGRLAYDAILERDYPTIQGAALVIALTYVAINTLTDIATARLTPEASLG